MNRKDDLVSDIVQRFETVATGLVEKGHNITIVSAHLRVNEVPLDNVHYIHMDKVLETLYTVNHDGDILSFFDSKILDGYKLSVTICKGFLNSSGWDSLTNYPEDFKVKISLALTLCY